MRRHAAPWSAVVSLLCFGVCAHAAPPPQYGAWGTVGPETPAPPSGWQEEQPPATALPSPTEAERRAGFIVLARDPLAPLAARGRRAGDLSLQLARGQYDSLAVAIGAIENLRGVRIAASALKGPGGAGITADQVDIRVARDVRVTADAATKTFRNEPWLLEKRPALDVAKEYPALIWLTVHAPSDAKPGAYTGTLTARAEGREAARLGLRVEVLPFALPEVPTDLGMYYTPASRDDMLAREILDMRQHGANVVLPAMAVEIQTRDQVYGPDDVEATRAYCQRMMGAMEKVYGPYRRPALFEAGHQIAYFWNQGTGWFEHWPHSAAIDSDLAKAIGVVADEAKQQGWNSLRVQALDEAGAHSLLDEARYYYGLIKQRYPSIGTYTTIGGGIAMGQDEIGKLSPVIDFFTTNRFTPEIARALIERKKSYGVYNGARNTVAGARFFFGFYGWKTGASEISQWAYHFGDPVFAAGGKRNDDDGYVYSAQDGPLPSPTWEAVREGIDDYRCTYLLAQTIAAAERSTKPGAKSAAVRAKAEMDAILGSIGWGFQAVSGDAVTPPPAPGTLRDWRRRMASQIVALATYAGNSLPAVRPPSPLDVVWAKPVEEKLTYGAEMLPAQSFTGGMKPWRVEVWSGKGSGEIDNALARAGHPSVRIAIPEGEGSNVVTVLVWPTWGEGGLNMKLGSGKTYELSAWVRLQGRALPPELRINTAAGTAASTRTGQGEPDKEGWRRVWVRVRLRADASPTYLAVWAQGPGTVWVADMSMREVLNAPEAGPR